MQIKAPNYVKSYRDGSIKLNLEAAFKSKKGKILLEKISHSPIPKLVVKSKKVASSTVEMKRKPHPR